MVATFVTTYNRRTPNMELKRKRKRKGKKKREEKEKKEREREKENKKKITRTHRKINKLLIIYERESVRIER